MPASLHRLAVALSLCAGAGSLAWSANAQPVIRDLGVLPGGAFSVGAGVSSDGAAACGYANTSSSTRAFRWTRSGGIADLGTLPDGAASFGISISADGASVTGYANSLLGTIRAFRWSASGMEDLGVSPGGTYSVGTGISGDGSVITGYGGNSMNPNLRAIRWSAAEGMQELGALTDGTYSFGSGVSADGSTVTGYGNTTGGLVHALRWTTAGGMEDAGTLPGGTTSYGSGVSSNGSVIVGYADLPGGAFHAFRATAATGLQDLGTLPGGSGSFAYGVSGDGSVVAGFADSPSGTHAFLWTSSLGMVDLNTYLASVGAELSGWNLTDAHSLSFDGTKIVGTGDMAGQQHAFLVDLAPPTPPPCAADYAVGSDPRSAIVGDFNNDTRPDIAVVNRAGASVSILLGTGGGMFAPALTAATGTLPFCIAAGQFNSDNVLDLAVGSSNGDGVSILLGHGDGTFEAASSIFGSVLQSRSIAVADFNSDLRTDLAVASDNHPGGTFSVLMGNGDGSFQAPVDFGGGAGAISHTCVIAADIDANGMSDVCVAEGSGSVSVLMGNGDGTFGVPQEYPAGAGPLFMQLADLNADTLPDLVVANGTGTPVSVLLGAPGGTFQPATALGMGDAATHVALSDLNGDTRQDILLVDAGSGAAGLMLGNGDGTFAAQVPIAPGPGAVFAAIGDLNDDTRADVCLVNAPDGTLRVIMGNGDGGVHQPPVITGQPAPATTHNCATGAASFVVSAMGEGPLTYQWRKDGVAIVDGSTADGTVVLGSRTAELLLTNTHDSDAGAYDCTVTNACGDSLSHAATLDVLPTCCDTTDFNSDGLFPDTTDIDDFLNVFSGGPCSNDPFCGKLDFNNDEVFPDTDDIVSLLSVFSGGPCL